MDALVIGIFFLAVVLYMGAGWWVWPAGGVVELGQAKGVPTRLNRAIADIPALHAAGTSL